MNQVDCMIYIYKMLNAYFVFNPVWIVVAVASGLVAFVLLEGKRSTRKRKYAGALVAYLVLVIFYTVLGRSSSNHVSVQLIPFWSYLMAAAGQSSFDHIFLNYLMFVPVGIMAPRLCSYRTAVKHAMFFSITIEVLQLMTMRGTCEIDDVIGNTFGVIIGCYICHRIRAFKTEMSKKYNSIFV